MDTCSVSERDTFELSLLPPRGCLSRKLRQEAELGIAPRLFGVGWSILTAGLTPACLLLDPGPSQGSYVTFRFYVFQSPFVRRSRSILPELTCLQSRDKLVCRTSLSLSLSLHRWFQVRRQCQKLFIDGVVTFMSGGT